MDYLNSVLLAILALLITGCNAPPYNSVGEKNSATVSIFSRSDNTPRISLKLRGKTFTIDSKPADNINSPSATKLSVNIPANEEITLAYDVLRLHGLAYRPELKSHVSIYVDDILENGITEPSLAYQADFAAKHTVNTCSDQVSFISSMNAHYLVFVEHSAGKVCQIYVNELIHSPATNQTIYKRIGHRSPVS